MPPSRRVTVAFALSVLLHLLVILLLALIPEAQLEAMLDREKPPDAAPLEIALQTEPAPTPEPTPDPLSAKAKPTPEPTPEPTPDPLLVARATPTPPPKVSIEPLDASRVIYTQLDPAHLKKADKAPEHPEFIASHNSVATRPKPRPPSAGKPGATRASTPGERDLAAMEQALLKKAAVAAPTPSSESDSMARPTPLPHPLITSPAFRTSLPRPTPTLVANAKPSVSPSPSPISTPAPALAASGLSGDTPPGVSGTDDEVGVDAIGKWNKAVGSAVGSCWNFYRQSKMDLLTVGEVRIKFSVDGQGHVSDVRIVSNTGSPSNAIYAVRSVREAEIPPVPAERLARLPGGRVEYTFTLTILPTQ